jgi:hypothetical protein
MATSRIFAGVLSIAALAITSLTAQPFISPALADNGLEPGSGTGTPAGKMEGAKGLFFEQLDKPSESLNTGLRYWIELKRDGVTSRVNNRQQFKSGDSIRFHVRSNINGFAYILLSSGSRGEQSVLFPDEKAGESNKVQRSGEIILPQTGYLTFDSNPGTEKLTLLLSRSQIDAQSYLAKPPGNKEIALIASADTGAKDLVPARIYVAFNAPRSDAPPPSVIAAANRPAEKPVVKIEKVEKTATKKTDKKVVKIASNTTTSSAPVATTSTTSKHAAVHRTPLSHGDNEENTTTVVSENAKGILHVDVDLQHI